MNKLKLISTVFAIILLQSCYKPGDIRIQNNINNVKIVDVRWGDIYLATELLPGETSRKLKIRKYDEKLPTSNKITFKMLANDRTIFLETEDEYLLKEDDDLLIVLRDDTKVKNPN